MWSFLRFASDDLQLAQGIRREVRHDGHEIFINEALGTLKDKWNRARRFVLPVVITDQIESFDDVRTRLNRAGHSGPTSGGWPHAGSLTARRPSIARRHLGSNFSIRRERLDSALQLIQQFVQWLKVHAAHRADLRVETAFDP